MNYKKQKTRTRKSKNKGKTDSIPQIRKLLESFDKQNYTNMSVDDFRKKWKQVIKKNIPYDKAVEYLNIRRRAKNLTRKHKKLRGGMAPVGYDLRPGVNGPNGNFLPYNNFGSGTLDLWNSGIPCKSKMDGGGFFGVLGAPVNMTGAPLTGAMNWRVPMNSPASTLNNMSSQINGGPDLKLPPDTARIPKYDDFAHNYGPNSTCSLTAKTLSMPPP